MRCETSTPFGRPVVPEVYMMAKGASTATDAAAKHAKRELLTQRQRAGFDRHCRPQIGAAGSQ
mgnify:CR=1 FL=1